VGVFSTPTAGVAGTTASGTTPGNGGAGGTSRLSL
jgi:hypothetical protein